MIAAQILYALILVFIGCMWIRLITSWVQVFAREWTPRGVLLIVLEAVYSVTDPPLKALRKVIPPIRIGNFALDIGFLLVFLAAYVALRLVAEFLL